MNKRLSLAAKIFDEVVEAPPERRAAILAARTTGDPELRLLVERFLANDREGMGAFLTPPAPVAAERRARTEVATRVGPYRIVSVLAEGSMGTVYRARQTEPIEREVALKVIRAGLDSREIVARFQAERQALALMDHPNIARVLDAGETERGQPYFVMEIIDGTPITEYCDRRRLGLPERLEMFQTVCEAVQHAHQKAVIHRDLKPSNVLVAEVNGKPVPKVIDFGVAKVLRRGPGERAMHTIPGMLIGTPEYMSPEHADSDNVDLDTRADVYSLGVILYELLVGSRPFEGGSTLSLMRRIREEEPKRPSTHLLPSDDRSLGRAWARGTQAPALRRLLRRDLDWIVMKALEKDRGRRYASPAELAGDVRRYLQEKSVTARPPSVGYRTSKFVRRHRLGVTSAGIVVAALLAAVAGTSTALVRARRAEALSRAEQERSQKASDFLASTLQGIDVAGMAYDLAATLRAGALPPTGRTSPEAEAGAPDPRFRGLNLIDEMRSLVNGHVLDEAVKRIETELGGEPALAADLYRAIGPAYAIDEPAVACLRHAVELNERAHGLEDPATLDAKLALGERYAWMEKYDEAEKILHEVIGSSRRVLGEDAPLTIRAIKCLGWTYQHRGQGWATINDPTRRPLRTRWSAQAVALLREARERFRRVLGEDDRLTLYAEADLALALAEAGDYAEAEELIHKNIARSTRVLGENDAQTINARMTLVAIMYYSGRVAEAIAMGQDVLASFTRASGDNDVSTLVMELKLGVLQLEEGRIDEAEPLLRDTARKLPLIMGGNDQFSRECERALARLERLKAGRGRVEP